MAKETWKPILVTLGRGGVCSKWREILINNKIPEYETPEEAIKTYLLMYKYYKNLALLYETPTELPLTESPPKNHLKAFIKRAVKEQRAFLSEEESKNFISNYGLPVIEAFEGQGGHDRDRERDPHHETGRALGWDGSCGHLPEVCPRTRTYGRGFGYAGLRARPGFRRRTSTCVRLLTNVERRAN